MATAAECFLFVNRTDSGAYPRHAAVRISFTHLQNCELDFDAVIRAEFMPLLLPEPLPVPAELQIVPKSPVH